jgi:pyrroline-5-carboxylate reductase
MSKIAFIGAGNMVSAIVKGMVKSKVFAPKDIACTSAHHTSAAKLATETGITHTTELQKLITDVENGGYIVLGFKPQQLLQMPEGLVQWTRGKIVISILAGTLIEKLRQRYPDADNIVRVMPNTPGQIGAGVSAYSTEKELSEKQRTEIEAILGSLGIVHSVAEDKIDAVTGISGSGPAYVFEFIAALAEAGTTAGLEAEMALNLSLHTVLGAAKLVEQTGEDPEILRNKVTSPNGTTQAALESMKADGFRTLVDKAVKACVSRSIELSQS